MGSIFRFEHKACGFEYKHFDGAGFMSMELEGAALEKIKKGEMGEDWKKALDDNPKAEVAVHNALCYCEKCKKYHSLPQIKLNLLEEKDGEEGYKALKKETLYCPECKEEVVDMDNVFSVPCPVCGEKIKGKFAGLWD